MLQKLRKLLTTDFTVSSAQVALATILTGAISYCVLLVGARVLSTDDLSQFVSAWAVLNTIALAFVLPADSYAPRLQLDLRRQNFTERDIYSVIQLYVALASGTVLFVMLLLWCVGILPMSWPELVASGLFLVAMAFFGGAKAHAAAHGRFGIVLRQSAVALLVAMALFLLIIVASFGRWPMLLSTVSASYFVAFLYTQFSLHRGAPAIGFSTFEKLKKTTLHTQAHKSLLSLILITLLTLLLSNGALIAARIIGTPAMQVVIYAAMLNLAMVPCMLLNAATPPLHLRIVELLKLNAFEEVRALYVRSMFTYSVVTLAIVGGAAAIGPFAIRLYVGPDYTTNRAICASIAAGEALATLTVLPRIFLTAVGQARSMWHYWVIGLAAFLLIILTTTSPLFRMITAPICASLLILGLTHRRVSTLLRG